LDGGLSPRVSRRVTLGQLCGKRTAEGVKVVADALMEGNGNAKTIAAGSARPSPPGSGSDSVTAAGRKNLRQKTSS